MTSKMNIVPLKYRDTYTSYIDVCAENILRLQDIWEDCGIDPTKIDMRMNKLFSWFQERWSTIIDDELQEVEAKREKVQKALHDLQELSTQLEIDLPMKPEGFNLQQQLEWVDETTLKINEIKSSRLAQLTELLASQKAILDQMTDVESYALPKDKILPNERELQELTTQVSMIKKEKRIRLDKLRPVLTSACALMERIGKVPVKAIEDQMFCTAAEDWDLTQSNIQLASETLKALQTEEQQLIEKYKSVKSNLVSLFDRLEITNIERDELIGGLDVPTYQNLQRLEELVEEYEELKRANMSKFVDRLKAEAGQWTAALRTGEPVPEIPGEPSEELIMAYEAAISRLKERHAKLTTLFKLLDDKQQLLDMLQELEEAQKDPNRYKNRGGGLLLETKKRERVNKNLPIVVRQILKFLDSYEPVNGEVIIDGKSIREEISLLEEKKPRHNSTHFTNNFTPLKTPKATPATPATTGRTHKPAAGFKRAGTYTELKPKANSLRAAGLRKAPDTVGKMYTRQMGMKSPASNSKTKLSSVKKVLRSSTCYGDFESIVNSNDKNSTRILTPANTRSTKLSHRKLMF